MTSKLRKIQHRGDVLGELISYSLWRYNGRVMASTLRIDECSKPPHRVLMKLWCLPISAFNFQALKLKAVENGPLANMRHIWIFTSAGYFVLPRVPSFSNLARVLFEQPCSHIQQISSHKCQWPFTMWYRDEFRPLSLV
jgi:hypothetical protein